MSTAQATEAGRHVGVDPGYGRCGLVTDPALLGLATSVVTTRVGPVTVRHGRRAPSSPSLPPEPVSEPGPTASQGPVALILLHGAAGSWSTWSRLIAAAPCLGLELNDLVIPDLPGWGDSALPKTPDRTIEAVAGSVADVARALGYRRWVVLGHSLGGFVALELAAAEPSATARVLLVSPTTFGVMDAVRHPVRALATLPAYVGMLTVMRFLAATGRLGTRLVEALGDTRMFRRFMAPLFAHPELIHPSVYRALAEEARPFSFAMASARAGNYDAEGRWAGIRCPVRSVHGSADVFVAATDEARLGAVIADFEGGTLADAGHFGHIERPLDVLRTFFAA